MNPQNEQPIKPQTSLDHQQQQSDDLAILISIIAIIISVSCLIFIIITTP